MARIYNNIAMCYLTIDTETAHLNIDPAITIERSLKNWPELAQCLDTRALIFLQERKLTKARKAIDEAIALLEVNDHKLRLHNFLVTRGRILAESDLVDDAVGDFFRAADLVEADENTEAARGVYREAVNSLRNAAARKRFNLGRGPMRMRELEQESDVIRAALQKCGGSVAKAAIMLGLERTTLIYRIDTHHPELKSLTRTSRRRSIV